MYGKIEDKALTIAPEGVTEGYFPVVFTKKPSDVPSGFWDAEWEMQNNEVVQTWVFVDFEDQKDNISDSEALEILLGGDTE